MTNHVRCPAGLHQFDADRYSVCPYCNSQQVTGGGGGSNSEVATRVLDRANKSATSDDQTTRPMDQPPAHGARRGGGEVTQVLRTSVGRKPVTGWLVVVEGPGKGAGLPVHHGVNSIGRDSGQGVCMDFSGEHDAEIARDGQARLTYDAKNNRFYLQHGDGTNLTYLNDEPVLELKTIKAYDRISMGKTELVFVPFCNDLFQWPND